MVTNEELMSYIKAKEQEMTMAQQELQNRCSTLSNVSQGASKPTMIQKAFRLFNDLTKPNQRSQYRGQEVNNFGEARMGESQVGNTLTSEVRVGETSNQSAELDYFKKLLRKKDIEIRKQRHMLTKVNTPGTYVKTDFMGNNNTLKIKPQKRIKLQRKFKW